MQPYLPNLLTIGAIVAAQLAPATGRAQLPLDRLNAPPGFAITVFAEVPGARSLAVAADGAAIYAGTRGDKVFAVRDPERDGVANEVIEVAGGLKVPNGIALAPDGALFVVEQHQISRFDPSGEREVVVPPGVLPDFRHHGWRYAAFGPDGTGPQRTASLQSQCQRMPRVPGPKPVTVRLTLAPKVSSSVTCSSPSMTV